MTINTVCPRDCPGRYPGCGAKCEKFLKHRAECEERYKKNLQQNEIVNAIHEGRKKISRE